MVDLRGREPLPVTNNRSETIKATALIAVAFVYFQFIPSTAYSRVVDLNQFAVRLPLPIFIVAWLLLGWLLLRIISVLIEKWPLVFKKLETHRKATSYCVALLVIVYTYIVHWHPSSWRIRNTSAVFTEERYCRYNSAMGDVTLPLDERIRVLASLTALAVSMVFVCGYIALLVRNKLQGQRSPKVEKGNRIFKTSGCCFLLAFFFYVTLVNRQAVDCMANYVHLHFL